MQEKFPHAPVSKLFNVIFFIFFCKIFSFGEIKKGKISLFSRYERVTDRRTFKDRRDLWAVEKEKPAFEPVRPKAKIKYVEEPKSEEFPRKKKNEPKSEADDETTSEQ